MCSQLIQLEKKYIKACFEGDIDTVNYMIKKENKNLKSKKLMCKYLNNACNGGHSNIFDVLVRYDKEVGEHKHVFFWAFQGGNVNIISKVIEIVNNLPDKPLNNKLLWDHAVVCACEGGKLDIFKLYVSRTTCDINFYILCFEKACKSGNIDLVYFIIEHYKKNLNLEWNWVKLGETAFKNACSSGNFDIIDLIIDNTPTCYESFECDCGRNCNIDFYEGMIGASSSNQIQVVYYMIENGARNWTKCLNAACSGGHIEIVKFMIKKGAYIHDNTICVACENGYVDIFRHISNICVQRETYDVDIFLEFACMCGDLQTIQKMIKRGATDWNNGLFYSCSGGHIDAVKLMLDRGATNLGECLQINCTEYSDNIHSLDISKLLISAGADNFECLADTNDFRLYCLYRKHSMGKGNFDPIIDTTMHTTHTNILRQYPPYILFIWSKCVGNSVGNSYGMINHTKRLPVELFRLLVLMV